MVTWWWTSRPHIASGGRLAAVNLDQKLSGFHCPPRPSSVTGDPTLTHCTALRCRCCGAWRGGGHDSRRATARSLRHWFAGLAILMQVGSPFARRLAFFGPAPTTTVTGTRVTGIWQRCGERLQQRHWQRRRTMHRCIAGRQAGSPKPLTDD